MKQNQTSTIHPGIFLGLELWTESVSPCASTIVSREQFKLMRIGENLVIIINDDIYCKIAPLH